MLKQIVQSCLGSIGFELRRVHKHRGDDPFVYMKAALRDTTVPTIFDVGANVGQSLTTFRRQWPESMIHAFEPGRSSFAALERMADGLRGVVLNQCALAGSAGSRSFLENSQSDMSSFLETSVEGWGETVASYEVPTTTVDQYLAEHSIDRIHLLKIDTQGFDVPVLEGAAASFRDHRVLFVFLELIFADLYRGQSRVDDVFRFLLDYGMRLVGIYNFHFHGEYAGWADALFVDPRAAATYRQV